MSQVQTSPAGDARTPRLRLGTARARTDRGRSRRPVTPTAPSAAVSTPRRLRRLGTALVVLGVVFGLLAAADVRPAGHRARPGQRLHRPAHPGAADPDQPARRRRDRHQRLPGRRPGAAGAAPGVRRRHQRRDDRDHRRRRRPKPADEQALSRLNEELVAYVALIEDARANNRQGFPVGAQYQRTASATLRADALPLLDNLVTANAQRAESQMGVWPIAILAVAGSVALAALVLAQVWLARRFRRRVNPGVVAATVVVLLTWVIGLIAVGATGAAVNADQGRFVRRRQRRGDRPHPGLQRQVEREPHPDRPRVRRRLREGLDGSRPPQVTTSLADSSPPLPRASGTPTPTSTDRSGPSTTPGKWDQAVRLATGTGAGSANATFGAFDEQTSVFLDRSPPRDRAGSRRFPGRLDHRRRPEPAGRPGRRRARPARRRGPTAGVPMRPGASVADPSRLRARSS